MSRMNVRAFLSQAKRSLAKSLQSQGEHPVSFVIGNESADLDSITSALVYGYIQSSTPEARKANRLTVPITNIPASDLRLRPELTALLRHADLKPSDLVTLDDLQEVQDKLSPENTDWTLVDHNVLQGELGRRYRQRVHGAIDHHDDEQTVPKDAKPRVIVKSGSCSSHVANYCRETWEALSQSASTVGAAHGQSDGALDDAAYTTTWDAQVAKLALGAILIDTVNLRAEDKVTEHDRKAIRYLEAKINSSPRIGPSYDRDVFFKEINDAKSDLDDLDLVDILRKDYKEWTEGDMTLGMSSAVKSIQYLQSKPEKLPSSILDFAKGRKLQLYAIMTACWQDGFSRQLLLVSVDGGKATTIANAFVEKNSEKLQLEASGVKLDWKQEDGETDRWMRVWEQKNLNASRKQVGPMLREVMRETQ